MRIEAGGRWIPVNIFGIQMEAAGVFINVEMDLEFGDESDANAAAEAITAGPWAVLFDRAEMVDGEKMLREAMSRGRPVTMEEAVARTMMGGLDNGSIMMKSVTIEPTHTLAPTLKGGTWRSFRSECRARAVGWFIGSENELDEILKGIEEA